MTSPISVSIRTAAGMLELPEDTIRQAVYVGEMPASRIGKRLRIATADLGAWFGEQA